MFLNFDSILFEYFYLLLIGKQIFLDQLQKSMKILIANHF